MLSYSTSAGLVAAGEAALSQISIPARFNGPPDSGNGGYSCGVVAAFIDGVARVRLHLPPPLDVPLTVLSAADDAVEILHDAALVASGWPAQLELAIPPAPSLEQARSASERFACYQEHVYASCFVCGTGRPHGDGLELFPGPVDDWSLVACSWLPGSDLADTEGNVRPEIVWAALDCPGCYGAMGETMVPVLLGELVADLRKPVPAEEELVVYAWPLGMEGRKYYGGVAIANAAGEVLACSHSTWIVLRS